MEFMKEKVVSSLVLKEYNLPWHTMSLYSGVTVRTTIPARVNAWFKAKFNKKK